MDAPLVIPIFIPHQGCPHQCAFCNQTALTTGGRLPDPESIRQTIDSYLSYRGQRSRVELAFFGGNFMGLGREKMAHFLDIVAPHVERGEIHGLRCSTRPDTITMDTLAQVIPHKMDCIELGIQSMSDAVLKRARRGHTARQSLQALEAIKRAGIKTGVQVMVGLPDDTAEQMLQTAQILAEQKPDFARIYPLLVLNHSPLAHWYKKGGYTPMDLDKSVQITKEIYKIFTRAGVKVIRMGLQASDFMEDDLNVLAGPWHPAFGHLVLSALVKEKAIWAISELLTTLPQTDTIQLEIGSRWESRLRGDKNKNLEQIQRIHPRFKIVLAHAPDLEENQIRARWA